MVKKQPVEEGNKCKKKMSDKMILNDNDVDFEVNSSLQLAFVHKLVHKYTCIVYIHISYINT